MIYTKNRASKRDIEEHFKNCPEDFLLSISKRINIKEYVEKIRISAETFEAWDEQNNLVGLIALYANKGVNSPAYITSVSVINRYQRKGISKILMSNVIDFLETTGFTKVILEVDSKNNAALKLYEMFQFIYKEDSSTKNIYLERVIK